jgi:hypothetical protein
MRHVRIRCCAHSRLVKVLLRLNDDNSRVTGRHVCSIFATGFRPFAYSNVVLELPILEAVIGLDPSPPNYPCLLTDLQNSIRNRLTALKKDRGDFIKSSDVNSLYQAVIKQGPSPHLIHQIFISKPHVLQSRS